MAFDSAPLTPEIADAVSRHWRIPVAKGERLHGGEESSAYRMGEHVVRIGPSWRSDAELEWAHAIASATAPRLPEALAPIAAESGATIVRVHRRPISVWPFRSGSWPEDRARLGCQAVSLLARLHRVLATLPATPRPGPAQVLVPAPDLDDEGLDQWLREFDVSSVRRQPLHGDFYAGNTLVEGGRLVALLDWDDAFIGPPERELAFAAWEWGEGLRTLDLTNAIAFVEACVASGGVARSIDDVTLRQLVRERLRREVRYARTARLRGVPRDENDESYEAREMEAFRALRP